MGGLLKGMAFALGMANTTRCCRCRGRYPQRTVIGQALLVERTVVFESMLDVRRHGPKVPDWIY